MKRVVSGLLIGLTMLASSSSLAHEVRFSKGSNSTIIKGRWDIAIDTYTFRARKGQKLNLALKSVKGSKGSLSAIVYSYCGAEFGQPIADRVASWKGTLPCSDKYSIDIITNVDTVTIKRPLRENYTLKIGIK
jgi:hypothetical protein